MEVVAAIAVVAIVAFVVVKVLRKRNASGGAGVKTDPTNVRPN